uniref:Uncharacterized protein n=1 Tax=Rhabditophanes sp. KR3021 TaxID=114890 RepID=A0AC35U9D7_9BILA
MYLALISLKDKWIFINEITSRHRFYRKPIPLGFKNHSYLCHKKSRAEIDMQLKIHDDYGYHMNRILKPLFKKYFEKKENGFKDFSEFTFVDLYLQDEQSIKRLNERTDLIHQIAESFRITKNENCQN